MNYYDFWVMLCNIPEYKQLAEQVLTVLVKIPCTYLCECGFSILAQVHQETIQDIDSLLRLAIEQEFIPDCHKLAEELQSQVNH